MTALIVRQVWQLRALRVVLVVALVLRSAVAIVAYHRQTTSAPDSITYVRPVPALIATHRFDTFGAPELARTPGYPVILAAGEVAGDRLVVTLGVQVIANCLTVFAVAVLALAMGTGTGVAVLAAALYAVEPSSIIYVAKILTETLFTLFATGLLIGFTCWLRGGTRSDLVFAAICLAVGCFVRPILYYAPLVLAALGVIAWRHQGTRSRAIAHIALFLVVALAPIVAWRVRNTIVAGYDGFAAIADVNLMEYRAAGAIARRTGRPIADVQSELRTQLNADQMLRADGRVARGHERTAIYHTMRARATDIIAHDPVAIFLDATAGAARMLFGRDTSEWAALLAIEPLTMPWQILRLALTVVWIAMVALAVIGLVRERWTLHGLVPAVVLSTYLIAVSAGPEAYSRFRLAVIPPIAVLSASGAYRISRGWGRRLARTDRS